jgi:hypothetical protein
MSEEQQEEIEALKADVAKLTRRVEWLVGQTKDGFKKIGHRVALLEDAEPVDVAPAQPYVIVREMTNRARENLRKGATFGAGTDVCATCKGEKEPKRINCYRCKTCDTAGRDTSRKGPKQDS